MKSIVTFMLCFPFFLWFLFQPIHNEITHMRGMAIEQTLNRGLQQAAVQGYFTEAQIDAMKQTLASIGFNPDDITFTGTEEGQDARVPRGGYITGQLSYPMNDLWALPGLFPDPNTGAHNYVRSGTMMSEYIVR